MKKSGLVLVGVALLAAAAWWLGQQPDQTLISKPAAPEAATIATGLRPVVHIANRPPVSMTLQERMDAHKVPGVSIAVMQNGKIVMTHAAGVRDRSTGAAINTETVFQAASISKPAFATILMRYREQNELDLDADINSLLTSWQLPEHPWQGTQDVTLRRLLSHTAGTTVHGFAGYAAGTDVPTFVQLLNGAAPANSPAVVVDIEPGKQFRYSGGGTSIAQQALEDISGIPLATLADTHLFGPLDMTRSAYAQPLSKPLSDNAAAPHNAKGQPVNGGAHTYAALAAAGMWTTPSDILKWAASIQQAYAGDTGQIVSPESAQDMLTNPVGPVGIGFFIDEENGATSFGHGGSNEGFRANFYTYMDSGDGIAVMTNGANGSILIREIIHRAAELYGWDDVQPPVKHVADMDADTLAQFAGRYRVTEPMDMEATITVGAEGLLLNAGDVMVDELFLPEETNKFFALNGSGMVFIRGDNDAVTGFEYRGFVKAVKID